MKQTKFPKGWDEDRVRLVLRHYEQQGEEEAVAEDEAAFEDPMQTMIEVPRELVPAIRELIAKHQNRIV
jgi:type II secretory pathway component PulC